MGIVNWRKSSYSSSNSGNCVEVAGKVSRVFVRDTQDRAGRVLRFDLAAWKAFTDRVKQSLASQGHKTRS